MTVLFGHPTGNPNSHHAALAHFEAGRLEAFCVPWMPSERTLVWLKQVEPLRAMARRLSRRRFAPLTEAPTIQGRVGEWRRLAVRAFGRGDEGLSYEGNDWLMRTMARELSRSAVTAVHAYEDCSLLQFKKAKQLGKACIYDMPIGYYPAWQKTQADLVRRYPDWIPEGGLPSSRYVRPDQKREEMALADLVLAPGSFVEATIREFHPDKNVACAAYGVDCVFWHSTRSMRREGPLRFIYAGQLSLRKGIPVLLQAWKRAALRDAELELVGSWHLAETKRLLPSGVTWRPSLPSEALRERFRAADVFVFPSFFEGLSLTLMEAMSCGLPPIASEAVATPAVVGEDCGRLVTAGDVDALVAALRWMTEHQDDLPSLSRAARARAEGWTWGNYRRRVRDAVAPIV